MALHVHFVIELLFVERDIVRVISHTHARMETNAPPERIKNLRYVSTGLEKVHFLVISNFGLSPDPFFPEKNYQNYQLRLFPRRDLPATFPRSFLMPWTSHNFLHNLRTNSTIVRLHCSSLPSRSNIDLHLLQPLSVLSVFTIYQATLFSSSRSTQ